MEKHLEKSLKILNILSILTMLVGAAELVAGTGKGIITPSAHVFCTWCVAGSGVLNVLVGVCGIRLSKGRAVICKPDMLIVHEGMFVLVMGAGVWLAATALTLVGIEGCLRDRIDEAPLCMVTCLFYVIAFLLFCDYQIRRIVLYGNYIFHTSFLGKERTFHKSEIKVATISLLGAWCVYGSDGKRLFYIEENMVNGKKFMGKMPNVFPISAGLGYRKIR